MANSIEDLGKDLGTAYHHGLQELWSVSSRWDIYETLFDDPKKVQLLNKTDGYFWLHIQESLFESVMLGLCRLTDPAATGKRQNLTILRLPALDTSSKTSELLTLVNKAVTLTEAARDWRNRKLAHSDYDRITTEAAPLKGTTRDGTTQSINAIHDVFAWIAHTHRDTHLSLPQLGDQSTQQLLQILYYGQDFITEKKQELGWWSSSERKAKLPEWLVAPRPKRYRS